MYDYIIIGSGPSGGNVAYNLHKAGAKVLLVEAGKFFRKNTFPKYEADTSAQLYWGGGIEFDSESRMAFLRARVMGGTSIVNQCLLDRFDGIAFNDWKSESGISWFTPEHMRQYYDTVEGQLKLHTFAPSDYNKNAQMFTKACDELGVKWAPLRKGQGDCAHERGNDCINCLGGCYRDSKQSSLVGYVQKAEKEGLQIAAETEIDRIETNNDTVTIHGSSKGQKVSYTAKNLVVAGGSFGTTKLLLQSGFKEQLPALGKYFTSHPQFMSMGVFDEPVNAQRGYFQTVASKDPNLRTKGFKLENVFAPPISMAVLYNRTGTHHQRFMSGYNNMACIEVAVRDENTGEIALKGNKLVVQKKLTDQDKRRRDEGVELIKNILLKQGAKEVIQSPYYIGLHLMGGAVIGTDATKSVVDPEFRVHGHKNIYIADSSIYPNAPGINPSLTIMALAQKLSEQLIAQR